ncbi:MAG TPA: SpoIID/LytB domain-containing protein [Sedimentisphaerales bacterium]|nr:SpoIID/LytB domain-containing protein [Sedimentisphaerales bacterium]
MIYAVGKKTKKPTKVFLVFICLTISGCAKRPADQPTIHMDIAPQFWVRVLLLDDIKACTVTLKTAFEVYDPQTAQKRTFQKPDAPITIRIAQGKITFAPPLPAPADSNDTWPATFSAGTELVMCPQSPYIFDIDGRDYRGKLKLVLNQDNSSFDAVNLVPLEPYLAGVVGAEMPRWWKPEALKAQAIAARTYCLYIKKRFGQNRHWDVTKTAGSQVYLGLAGESAQIWRAVNATIGRVLACQVDDRSAQEQTIEALHGTDYVLFPAYYSSVCGGHSENSQNVFGGRRFEPLAGVPCPYCKKTAKTAYLSWQAEFDYDDACARLQKKYQKLKSLGKIDQIVPAAGSDYQVKTRKRTSKLSRLTMIKLVGSTGKTEMLRAEDFRLSIDPSGNKFKSTICTIETDQTSHTASVSEKSAKTLLVAGSGFGHGVGMCQHGAQAMAKRKKNARQILSHYYPNSKIISIY